MGSDLYEQVFYSLDLIEKDYFGLQFTDANNVQHWLDATKVLKKQVKSKYRTTRYTNTTTTVDSELAKATRDTVSFPSSIPSIYIHLISRSSATVFLHRSLASSTILIVCLYLPVPVGPPYTFRLKVKFYSPEPNTLREELTRYQFFLQLKQDLLDGRLECDQPKAIELCSLALQCESQLLTILLLEEIIELLLLFITCS